MKQQKSNQENTVQNESIPMDNNLLGIGITTETKSSSRKLDKTPALISVSNMRAHDLIKAVNSDASLASIANETLDSGDYSQLVGLISRVYDEAKIADDAAFLLGTSDDEFSKLLESRRSDRSKAKKLNVRSSFDNPKRYISAGYAEMLIRQAWNKPYSAQADGQYDLDALKEDAEALGKKIRSLQSKKSRLSQLAKLGDVQASKELTEVTAEIDRLNALRPNTRQTSTTVVKNVSIDTLREVLKNIDLNAIDNDEERARLAELKAKIG